MHKVPFTSHIYSKNHSDDSISDDSDYEDNIPLQIVQCLGNPLFVAGLELKKCLHKERVIKCETQRELWDLEDYEAIAPKIEHKPVT